MPIYNYRCDKCGKHFERVIARTEVDEQDCPECKSTDVSRLISSFGSYSINGNNSASTRPRGGGGRKV